VSDGRALSLKAVCHIVDSAHGIVQFIWLKLSANHCVFVQQNTEALSEPIVE